MPPLLFTSSMASFTSRGLCARARRGASTAAVPVSPILMAVRRPIGEGVGMRVVSLWLKVLWIALRVRQPQIRAADPIVGEQGLVRPLEDDVTGFQHVAVIRALERLGHALLHEEDA